MNNLEQSKAKTMKKVDRITFKDVVGGLKEEKHGLSPQLFWFVFLTIISLGVAYLLPYSLILTIPLVIVPSWFAFNSVNSLKGVKNADNVTFFLMFRNYFSQFFFGGYRLLFGLLKAFIAYIVGNSIGYIIFDIAVLSKNAEYQALIEKMANTADFSELSNELMNIINNPEFEKPLFFMTAISILIAMFVFTHHVLKHSPKMRRNLFTKSPMPMKQFYPVDRRVRKMNRSFIWKSYFSTTWFIQLLMILVGTGGIVLSYFFLKQLDPIQAVVISLFLVFIVLIPFANYINIVQTMIYLELAKKYEQTLVNMTLEFLDRYKDKIGIEEEEAKKLQDFLEAQKKANEESTKEDKPEEK